MTEIAARDARDNWADLLDRVQWRDERFVITRNGKPIAQLTPLDATPTDKDQ